MPMFESNGFGPFIIKEEMKGGKCLIQFINTGFEAVVYKGNALRGEVKDKLKPVIYGVAFVGDGGFNPTDHKPAYKCWMNMLYRCYSSEFHEKEPSYKECYVCVLWLNFQNFAEWYYKECPGEGYDLDKDILYKGNKGYRPDRCCWVPHKLNQLLCLSKGNRGKYKIGVCKIKNKGRFEVRCGDGTGKRLVVGYTDSEEDGFVMYKKFKENVIKQLAKEYYNSEWIERPVFDALMNYKVESND